MDIREKIKNGFVFYDGGTGTVLQSMGLKAGERPETWNVLHPENVTELHYRYFSVGCNIVNANTFGATRLNFPEGGEFELRDIISSGIKCAKKAAERAEAERHDDRYVAMDVSPTGRLLKPYGDLDFEEAVSIFKESIKIGAESGADLITIETMTDLHETKAALIAAKEVCDLPVFVSTTYTSSGRTMTGGTPEAAVALCEALGADAVGLNCGLGPVEMLAPAGEFIRYASVPVAICPNAGIPRLVGGETVYDVTPEAFADGIEKIVSCGARIVGGCCGTNSLHMAEMIGRVKNADPAPVVCKNRAPVSSGSKVEYPDELNDGDIGYVDSFDPDEACRLADELIENGVKVLSICADHDGVSNLEEVVSAVCELSSLPVILRSVSEAALEAAVRRYNGRPGVTPVGFELSEDSPVVKKYGALLIK